MPQAVAGVTSLESRYRQQWDRLSACGSRDQARTRPSRHTRCRGCACHATRGSDARAWSAQADPADLSRRHPPLQADEQDPPQALNASAGIIRSFIEDYHEHSKSNTSSPSWNRQADLRYHQRVARSAQRGRALTDRMLSATAGAAALLSLRGSVSPRHVGFIRMYEPHEAREDTVVFPACGMCCRLRSFVILLNASKTRSTSGSVCRLQGVVERVAISKRASASTT